VKPTKIRAVPKNSLIRRTAKSVKLLGNNLERNLKTEVALRVPGFTVVVD
jgi:hypothetical protein